ncbi:MAG: DUF2281 domain-containing protein [Gallionella sp.]|nr:DUF2281 domain-containing protein [Gallionella sp.]MDD4959428.1 DUF2281 domain-containing protein [Gallionella sp.]
MGYAELLETLQNLPQDKQEEVFDFVKFLAAKSTRLAPNSTAQAKLHEYQQTLASFEQKYAMTTAAFQHAF